MSAPALALIGAGGEIEQTTAGFRRRYERQAELCKRSPQLERVLIGQADRAVVSLDGVSAEIEAVTDAAGVRHALLTLAGADPSGAGEEANALLTEPLDDSPAAVWLKDLEGRYLRVNQPHTALLGTPAERLLGRTDAELAPRETVDGPRLREGGGLGTEPLQLEYSVPPFEHRPWLAALRFAVHDRAGRPIAVCGVAAPLEHAAMARAEASRLIDIERWSPLDAGAARDEVMTQWGVVALPAGGVVAQPAPGGLARPEATALAADRRDAASQAAQSELLRAREELAQVRAQAEQALADVEASAREHRGRAEQAEAEAEARGHAGAESARAEFEAALQAALAERDAALATNAELLRELEEERQALAALRRASDSAAAHAAELASAVQRERSRTDELVQALAPGAARQEPVEDPGADPSGAQSSPAVPAPPNPETPRPGPDWPASGQRELVSSLAAASGWRAGLEEALGMLGSAGGWDVVRAWVPDEPGTLRCTAMWTALGGLSDGEPPAAGEPRANPGSLLAHAIHSPSVIWLTDIEATDDERLRASAAHGMSSVVLLPIRDGGAPIGMLELLTHTRIEPDPRLALALEAAALQLGRFADRLRLRS